MSPTPEQLKPLVQLIETVHRLRAPGGCPWDREQTHQTLRQFMIEEAYEAVDVMDQIDSPQTLKVEKIKNSFKEELGDVLLQVLLNSEMASETGAFDVYQVAETLNQKLVYRHPHVFGQDKVDSADEAYKNWEKLKAKEKKSGVLAGLPKGMPSLQRTAKVIEKVTKVGFQWEDMEGPLDKLEEELNELKAEIRAHQKAANEEIQAQAQKRIESEIGDLLFSVCNVAFLLKVTPEDALRNTLHRFESRFNHVEARLKEQGKSPDQSTLQEMDQYWNEAKAQEKK